jgi:hypothetical protein
MQTETNTSRKRTWLVATLVFLAMCWLAANWQDFKSGVVAGYSASKP